jgi:hypothetical protein
MSQRQQLKLVFSTSKPNLKIETLPSRPRSKLRGNSSRSSFQRKVATLEQENPAAAQLLEQLVDDALAADYRMFAPPWAPLE